MPLILLITFSASLLKSAFAPAALILEIVPSLSTTKVTTAFITSPLSLPTTEVSKLLKTLFLKPSIPPAKLASTSTSYIIASGFGFGVVSTVGVVFTAGPVSIC